MFLYNAVVALHFAALTYLAGLSLVAASTKPAPVKVFLLAGQSNMEGYASIEHLHLLINESDTNEYRRLWNGTAFIERDDVYMKFKSRQGKLAVGTGFAGTRDNFYKFGPELGFGWTIGDATEENETVVIIKSAYGGRNLAVDFRPPASGEGNYSEVKPVHYGWVYRQMMLDFVDGLDKIADFYPDYDKDAGYELAGFVWFQGWDDMLSWPYVKEYEWNLANFIRDVRLDLDAPDLPFIVGELGQRGVNVTGSGSDQIMAMRAAERGVTMMDEFRNNTLFVPTALYVGMNGTAYTAENHYYGRADTYYHIGQAMGRGMLELITKRSMRKDEEASSRSFYEGLSFPSLPF
jgi:hypothetical protein